MDQRCRLRSLFATLNEEVNSFCVWQFILNESQTYVRNRQFKQTFDNCVAQIHSVNMALSAINSRLQKNILTVDQVIISYKELDVFITNVNMLISLVYNEIQNQHKIINGGDDPETIYSVKEWELYAALENIKTLKSQLMNYCNFFKSVPMNASQQKNYSILKNKLKINPRAFMKWCDPIFDDSVKMERYKIM